MDKVLRAYNTDIWEHRLTKEKFHPVKTNIDFFGGDRIVLQKDESEDIVEISSFTFKSDYVRTYFGGREYSRSFLL
ncbi:MAG: hypothetical protein ACRC2K_04250 [Clostridium sp.]